MRVQHKACMIEAFRHDAGSVYHIVKRCLVECPAFVNGSAEHTRCCAKEACNDVISIGNNSCITPVFDIPLSDARK